MRKAVILRARIFRCLLISQNIRIICPLSSPSNKLSDRDQLVGDFNIQVYITWSPEAQSNILLPLAQHDFIDGLLDLSLSQVNYIRNSLGRLLDLCLVTSPESVFLSRVAPLTQPEDPYHPTFQVAIGGTRLYGIKSKFKEVTKANSLFSQGKLSEAKQFYSWL